jgi:hypothetical protein
VNSTTDVASYTQCHAEPVRKIQMRNILLSKGTNNVRCALANSAPLTTSKLPSTKHQLAENKKLQPESKNIANNIIVDLSTLDWKGGRLIPLQANNQASPLHVDQRRKCTHLYF